MENDYARREYGGPLQIQRKLSVEPEGTFYLIRDGDEVIKVELFKKKSTGNKNAEVRIIAPKRYKILRGERVSGEQLNELETKLRS